MWSYSLSASLMATDTACCRAACVDPGRLPQGPSNQSAHDLETPLDHAGFCLSCRVYRPMRSKHCQMCNRYGTWQQNSCKKLTSIVHTRASHQVGHAALNNSSTFALTRQATLPCCKAWACINYHMMPALVRPDQQDTILLNALLGSPGKS